VITVEKKKAATIERCCRAGDSCDTMANSTGPVPDQGEGKLDNCPEHQAIREGG